jgi:hypothetical protein
VSRLLPQEELLGGIAVWNEMPIKVSSSRCVTFKSRTSPALAGKQAAIGNGTGAEKAAQAHGKAQPHVYLPNAKNPP